MSTRPLLGDSPKPIEGEVVDPLAEIREEVRELRDELELLRQSYERDRDIWGGILRSLQAAFGGRATPAGEPTVGPGVTPAYWDSLKRKLGGKKAEFIQTMLDHGPMTKRQLRVLTKSGDSTVDAVLAQLRELSLVQKDGDRWTLRQP